MIDQALAHWKVESDPKDVQKHWVSQFFAGEEIQRLNGFVRAHGEDTAVDLSSYSPESGVEVVREATHLRGDLDGYPPFIWK